MILKSLPDPEKLCSADGPPLFRDHCLYVKQCPSGFSYPEHYAGLGVVALLNGSGKFAVNTTAVYLDVDSFLVLNRGSKLSFRTRQESTLCLLYFNSTLADILSERVFQISPQQGQLADARGFSLLEHVHYQNASLKPHLEWLLNLGNSCASFHSLKADMLIRPTLDEVVSKNDEAIRVASHLPVVKKETRISLYKRLSLARQWMEQHYASQIQLQQAADIAMLSQEHFLRMFRRAFGQTPHQFLTGVRIAKARKLLERPDVSVAAVCQQVGFESLSSFSDLFKRWTGLTPAAYRKAGLA